MLAIVSLLLCYDQALIIKVHSMFLIKWMNKTVFDSAEIDIPIISGWMDSTRFDEYQVWPLLILEMVSRTLSKYFLWALLNKKKSVIPNNTAVYSVLHKYIPRIDEQNCSRISKYIFKSNTKFAFECTESTTSLFSAWKLFA